jgi:hypothetical protein
LSCPSTQQTGGHENESKTPVFNKFAPQILGIFDESGSAIRKACTGGQLVEKLFKELQTNYKKEVKSTNAQKRLVAQEPAWLSLRLYPAPAR